MGKTDAKAEAGAKQATGFLATVERVGNMVPHPAIIFFILTAIVIAFSVLFGMLGTQVFWGANPRAPIGG